MPLDLASILLWGFVATLVFTTLLAILQGLHQTRMSVLLVLGTIFSADLGRARAIGLALQIANGCLFALVYGLILEALGRASAWIGLLLGLGHGLFVLAVVLPTLPSIHPRMASEDRQPEPTAFLEPPGFLGLHYGLRTPLVIGAAHLLYGAILGAFYEVT